MSLDTYRRRRTLGLRSLSILRRMVREGFYHREGRACIKSQQREFLTGRRAYFMGVV